MTVAAAGAIVAAPAPTDGDSAADLQAVVNAVDGAPTLLTQAQELLATL